MTLTGEQAILEFMQQAESQTLNHGILEGCEKNPHVCQGASL